MSEKYEGRTVPAKKSAGATEPEPDIFELRETPPAPPPHIPQYIKHAVEANLEEEKKEAQKPAFQFTLSALFGWMFAVAILGSLYACYVKFQSIGRVMLIALVMALVLVMGMDMYEQRFWQTWWPFRLWVKKKKWTYNDDERFSHDYDAVEREEQTPPQSDIAPADFALMAAGFILIVGLVSLIPLDQKWMIFSAIIGIFSLAGFWIRPEHSMLRLAWWFCIIMYVICSILYFLLA